APRDTAGYGGVAQRPMRLAAGTAPHPLVTHQLSAWRRVTRSAIALALPRWPSTTSGPSGSCAVTARISWYSCWPGRARYGLGMVQVIVYARRTSIDARRQQLSDAIHGAVVAALDYPAEKRFHRFFGLDAADFVYPEDRGDEQHRDDLAADEVTGGHGGE
ncbi:hypothetical protein IAE22_30850, partial [Bacillus sp. S34]|nr:hypothetical protein [Bacillus sp. S34]